MLQRRQFQKQGEELNKLIRGMLLTLDPLDADYDLAGLCADIEARLYLFRRTALAIADISKVSFTKEEREILTETRTVVEMGWRGQGPNGSPLRTR
jgi:hypothetical protein